MNLDRWQFSVEPVAGWFLSLRLHPRLWAVRWHSQAPCCKWWLLIGPFEVNRVWTDADDYPFGEDDADEAG